MEEEKMSKSNISRLAKSISSKRGLTQAEAERFISKMFDVANEGLQEDKLLKMKWLGTFKVTPVKDRESVDVNTGERIVIEGRDKISFTPDNILKEIVNKPFAQFETVVVNDGVDFSDIDEKFSLQAVPTEPIAAGIPNTIGEQKTPEASSAQTLSKGFGETKIAEEQKVGEQPMAEEHPSAEAEQIAEEQSSAETQQMAEEQSSEETQPMAGDQPMAEKQQTQPFVGNTSVAQESLVNEDLLTKESSLVSDNEVGTSNEAATNNAAVSSNEAATSNNAVSSNDTAMSNDAATSNEAATNNAVVTDEETIISNGTVAENGAELSNETVTSKVDTPANPDLSVNSKSHDTNESRANEETLGNDVSRANEESPAMSNHQTEEAGTSEPTAEVGEEEHSHHLIIPKYLVAIVCLAFVILLGGMGWFAFNFGKMQAQRDQLAMQLQTMKKPTPVATKDSTQTSAEDSAALALKKKAQEDSIRMAETSKAVEMAEKTEQDRVEGQASTNTSSSSAGASSQGKGSSLAKGTAPSDPRSSSYDADPRVRTGAYRIVGVAQTVTVKEGQSLASLSSQYLGPGMECYVEAVNGAKEVKAGQKIKIPKLELKRKKK